MENEVTGISKSPCFKINTILNSIIIILSNYLSNNFILTAEYMNATFCNSVVCTFIHALISKKVFFVVETFESEHFDSKFNFKTSSVVHNFKFQKATIFSLLWFLCFCTSWNWNQYSKIFTSYMIHHNILNAFRFIHFNQHFLQFLLHFYDINSQH